MPSILAVLLAALATSPVVVGHSWGEQLRNIDDNGKYVGAYGYPRGMVDRGETLNGLPQDQVMTWRMPASGSGNVFIDDKQLLCATSQREQKQISDKYPRLKSPPGGYIAIRYQENGHVTKPQTNPEKPKKGGTIYVYGTKDPKSDEKLIDVLQWTQDGKGGDKRGVLLAMNDYDDGRCYLNNDTPVANQRKAADPAYMMNTPQSGPANSVMYCETDVKLPDTMALNQTYTLYWVWQWTSLPQKAGDMGKDEYYSTCMDIDAAAPRVAMAAEAPSALAKFALAQQDAVSTALSDFKSRTALFSDLPLKREMGAVTSGLSGGGFGGDVPAPTGTLSKPTHSNGPPVSFSTLPSASRTPFGNPSPSSSTGRAIPTLTGRPGAVPTHSPSGNGNGNVVTVTDVVMVTVTAPAITVTAPATTAPAATLSTPSVIIPGVARSIRYRNGAKFRSLSAA